VAQPRYWCQLRADILGRPVHLPENAEAALGMAMLAASVGRRVSDVAKQMVRIREVIDPGQTVSLVSTNHTYG
jgi:D-ribulokinase